MSILEIYFWSLVVVAATAIGAMIAHQVWRNLSNAFSAMVDSEADYKARWKNAVDEWTKAERDATAQMRRADELGASATRCAGVTRSAIKTIAILASDLGGLGKRARLHVSMIEQQRRRADAIWEHLLETGRQLVRTENALTGAIENMVAMGRALNATGKAWPDTINPPAFKPENKKIADKLPRIPRALGSHVLDAARQADEAQYAATIEGELPGHPKPPMPDRPRHAFDGDPMTTIPTAKSRTLRRAWENLNEQTTPAGHNRALLEYQDLHRQVHGWIDPNARPWRLNGTVQVQGAG